MKKLFLSIVTVVACALSINATVETLTVANGTATSEYAPIYTTWFSTANATPHSQVIYTASMLENMVGGQITGVRYYFAGNGNTMQGGKFNLSIGEASKDSWSFFDETPLEGLAVVKADVVAPELGASVLEITFDTPYEYNGGNLGIETLVTEAGNMDGSTYFYGMSMSNSYPLNYAYYNSDADQRYVNTGTFMPKTTFIYEVETKPYDVRIEPESLNFGRVLLGDVSELTLTITNRGANAVTPVMALDAPFTVDYTTTTLGNEESITVTVKFAPTDATDYSTVLNIDCGEGGIIEVPITAAGTDTPEITVCDGTDTEEHLPIYGYYFDSEVTNTQMIYPAEMLTKLAGNKITGIKFYPTAAMSLTSGKAAVSMGTATGNDASVATDGMVEVATIAPQGGETELTITLNEPYIYEGGALAIKTQMTEKGNYAKTYFYGQSQDNRLGFCQWSNYSSSTYLFLPKMTIYYETTPTAINTIDNDCNAQVKSIKYVNPMGQVSSTPFNGINIVVTEYTNGTTKATKVLK